jgi:hypothetical protein
MVNLYYWISKSGIVLVLVIMGCLQGLRAQTLGSNIIVNGDAENVQADTLVGWSVRNTADFGNPGDATGGVWWLAFNSTYPSPSHGASQSHGGNYFFNAGTNFVPETETAQLTQYIDVTAFSGQDITYSFNAWVSTNGFAACCGGYNTVQIKVEYLDDTVSHTDIYAAVYDYAPSSSTFSGWFNIAGSQNVLGTDGVGWLQVSLIAQNTNTSSSIQAYFDDVSLTPNPTTLPVKLIDFHALQQPDQTVALQWETAQEQNSKYTEVQRSADGKTFLAIGQVAAAGNSVLPRNYAFTDKSPLSGRAFYRLKMVDLDGSSAFSKIIQVTSGAAGTAITVYSNPFHDQLGVMIPAVTSEKLVLSLFDQTGKICLRQNYTTQKGNNFVNLYPGGMAAGVYLLHLQGAQTNQTIRVLKQ